MRHLFSYLAPEGGHPHPYTEALHRYSEQKQRRPATLSADFIRDLLEVTGNGRARCRFQRPGYGAAAAYS